MKKIINTRLSAEEKSDLSGLIGKTFNKYRSDEFHYRPAVYKAVGIFVDDQIFLIENKAKPIDYYGSIEDVGVISVISASGEDIHSCVENGVQVDTPVNQIIQNIRIIEDTHIMMNGDETLYEFSYTKAIVFMLSDDREIVFEKDVWFSEDIYIYCGSNAEDKIMTVESEIEDSDEYEFRARRSLVDLAKS